MFEGEYLYGHRRKGREYIIDNLEYEDEYHKLVCYFILNFIMLGKNLGQITCNF